jgi:predicted ATPase
VTCLRSKSRGFKYGDHSAKHTILLTIALLAESHEPLIIDQPEDDLDNAFIFSSVVRTLRYIKERRQVFIVTHNANIAVLW